MQLCYQDSRVRKVLLQTMALRFKAARKPWNNDDDNNNDTNHDNDDYDEKNHNHLKIT